MTFGVKKITMLFLCIIVGVFVLALLSAATKKPAALWEAMRYARNTERAMEALKRTEALEKADTYGGSTPEETFDMFLAALKAGDTDLASKYFVLAKQWEWEENLRKTKDGSKLDSLIAEATTARQVWKKTESSSDRILFDYLFDSPEQTIQLPNGQKATFPAGQYGKTIIFMKNLNSKWKIERL